MLISKISEIRFFRFFSIFFVFFFKKIFFCNFFCKKLTKLRHFEGLFEARFQALSETLLSTFWSTFRNTFWDIFRCTFWALCECYFWTIRTLLLDHARSPCFIEISIFWSAATGPSGCTPKNVYLPKISALVCDFVFFVCPSIFLFLEKFFSLSKSDVGLL